MLNTQSEGSTVDYAALIESKAATKDKFKLKKVVSSPGGLTVKGLTVKVIGPPTNQPRSCCGPSTPHARTFARAHTRAHTRTISLSLRAGACLHRVCEGGHRGERRHVRPAEPDDPAAARGLRLGSTHLTRSDLMPPTLACQSVGRLPLYRACARAAVAWRVLVTHCFLCAIPRSAPRENTRTRARGTHTRHTRTRDRHTRVDAIFSCYLLLVPVCAPSPPFHTTRAFRYPRADPRTTTTGRLTGRHTRRSVSPPRSRDTPLGSLPTLDRDGTRVAT